MPLKRGRDRAYCSPPFLFSVGGAGDRAVRAALSFLDTPLGVSTCARGRTISNYRPDLHPFSSICRNERPSLSPRETRDFETLALRPRANVGDSSNTGDRPALSTSFAFDPDARPNLRRVFVLFANECDAAISRERAIARLIFQPPHARRVNTRCSRVRRLRRSITSTRGQDF